MIWFWVVVLVIIIGAAAVIAAGRGDAMADVYEDRPDTTIERGQLTADDLANVHFTTAVRGYRMDEVDAFLRRMESELLARDAAAAKLERGTTPEPEEPAASPAADATSDEQAAQDDPDEPDDSTDPSPNEPSTGISR